MIKKIKPKYILIIIVAILIAVIIYNLVSIYSYSKIDEKQQADVAIVLGAGTDDDIVSPVFAERINHAVWLYENKYIDKIIITGGVAKGNEHSDSYVAKQYAITLGIPTEDILLEEQSTITQENLENAKILMDDNGYNSAIIVSDPLHMKRAMLLARDAGITEAYSSPTPTTRYTGFLSKTGFISRELFFYVGYQIYRLLPA